ncbi:uncharacterized protein [Littorina saxatilis]|uniref:uncharacterized protein n=1 Tax=Littorina saxatilis TaxID=31220 RepID=UPI0038B4914C
MMEKGTLAWAVVIFILVGKQEVGTSITNCVSNKIHILENKNNTIVCDGLRSLDSVEWSVTRRGLPKGVVAVCGRFGVSGCTSRDPNFAVQRSATQSKLFYQQYNNSLDLGAEIFCAVGGIDESCGLNVITGTVKTTMGSANGHNNERKTKRQTCDERKRLCADGTTCVWITLFCEGHNQCPDNSDEDPIMCRTHTCTTSFLKCANNVTCIHNTLQCDGYNQCPDNSDEDPEMCKTTTESTELTTGTTTETTTEITTETTELTTETTTETPIRVSITTSVQGGQEGTAITLQRGQKNVGLTCRYDNTTGWAGLLSWCKTGSSCSKDPGSAGSSSTRHCLPLFVRRHPNLPLPSLPYPTLPHPNLPHPSLPHPNLPHPTLPHPNMPHPTLPHPNLPHPTLPHPTCRTPPCRTQPAEAVRQRQKMISEEAMDGEQLRKQ